MISFQLYVGMAISVCSRTWQLKWSGLLFFQVRIARIFNTYGPRMCLDDGRVVSNFVAQVCSQHRLLFIFI